MNQFLYLLTPARLEMLMEGSTERETAIVAEHFAHLERLTEQGVALLMGRTQNNDERTFGIVIFQAETEAAARELMNSDPAVIHGVMRAELFPFRIGLCSL